MRDFQKSNDRRVRAGWLWPLVLLALPMCSNNFDGLVVGTDPEPAFDPGTPPLTGAILCDIPRVVGEGSGCASPEEAASGMSLAHAAVALNLGEINAVVLDFSSDACGGLPRKIEFYGPFPDGFTVCLNCGQQIPAVYADLSAVCVAQCKDLINVGSGPIPPEGVNAFCTANARVSTNFDKSTCSPDFCSNGGTPLDNDPRRDPEDLTWMEVINTTATGNTLSFAGPETGGFSAGAASEQLIATGDAWVEFRAGETGVSHVLGVRATCPVIADCPDTDGTLADIPLALNLDASGEVNVVDETGAVLAGPFPPAYSAGQRFRIHVVDHNDNTADISFSRLAGSCDANMSCLETVFYTHPVGTGPSYPLRVDATFREANASLTNVTIMRIK